MKHRLVNRAGWPDPGAPQVPDGWLIANAPRPLAGQLTWQGPFRHGIFYAASPHIPEGTWGWAADDAELITFTDNTAIEQACAAKVREHGYPSLAAAAEDGITIEELAAMLALPWHPEATR